LRLLERLASGAWIERALPLPIWDAVFRFYFQTRVIFSRATLLLVAALLVSMSIPILTGEIRDIDDVFGFVTFQTMVLAILIHMNLWQTEREERTFELLVMRVPSVHRLIGLKLGVSLAWLTVLAAPPPIGFAWFLDLPLGELATIGVFALTAAYFVALLTCAIGSLVRSPLATGVVAFVASMFMFGISQGLSEARDVWKYAPCFAPFLYPFGDAFSAHSFGWKVLLLSLNRAFVLALCGLLYAFLYDRLSRTEKWIG
jgi:hypothetical protein